MERLSLCACHRHADGARQDGLVSGEIAREGFEVNEWAGWKGQNGRKSAYIEPSKSP
jgi:hypothetical protein